MSQIYHGTQTGILKDILFNGNLTRGNRRGNWPDAPSRPDYVYLTTAYPLYFAVAFVPNKGNALPVVIEIDITQLDEKLLCPDEDYIAQVLWQGKQQGQRIEHPLIRRARTLEGLAKRINPADYQGLWPQSLEGL